MKISSLTPYLRFFSTLLLWSSIVIYSATQIFAANPVYQWTKVVGEDSFVQLDSGNSIVVDSHNNVYYIGTFSGTVDFDPGEDTDYISSAGSFSGFVTKINADGSYGWTKSIAHEITSSRKIVISMLDDSLYWTGQFSGTADFDPGEGTDLRTSNGSGDIFISKYNSDGSYAWTKTFGGTGDEAMSDLTSDTAGNLYLSGKFQDTVDFNPEAETDLKTSNGFYDVFISKYSSTGGYEWTATYQQTITYGGSGNDTSTNLATDSLGNLYVTGQFQATVDFDPGEGTEIRTATAYANIYVAQYTTAGEFVWVNIYDTQSLVIHDIAISPDDEGVYMAGVYNDSGTFDFDPTVGEDNRTGGYYLYVTKLNTDGSYGWTKSFENQDDSYNEAYSIDFDLNGYMYLTGYFSIIDFDPGEGVVDVIAPNYSYDSFVLRLTSDGEYSWVGYTQNQPNDYGWSASGYDSVIDGNNNLFVLSSFSGLIDFDPLGSGDIKYGGNSSAIALTKYSFPSYSVEYTAGANGTLVGTSSQSVAPGGSSTSVTAVGNAGYAFLKWSDDRTDNPRVDTNVSANVAVSAIFTNTTTISQVTPEQMTSAVTSGFISIAGEDPTATPNFTFNTSFTFLVATGGAEAAAQVVIPAGTVVTKKGGGTLDLTQFITQSTTALVQAELSNTLGALRVGIPAIGLTFSNPITISIPVPASYDGKTVDVYFKEEGGSEWQSQTTCLVALGICSFQTTHATSYAARSIAGTPPVAATTSRSSGGGGGGSSSSGQPGGCSNSAPQTAVDLFQIDAQLKTAKLYFAPLTETNDYYVSFGTTESAEGHGAAVSLSREGVQSYDVFSLQPNTTYYFKVRGQNGCATGPWSSVMKVKTNNRIYYKSFLSRVGAFFRPLARAHSTIKSVKAAEKPVLPSPGQGTLKDDPTPVTPRPHSSQHQPPGGASSPAPSPSSQPDNQSRSFCVPFTNWCW